MVEGSLRISSIALLAGMGACSVLVPFDEYTAGSASVTDAAPPPEAGPSSSSGGERDASSSGGEAGPPCGDVLSTSEHCGRCDHDCLGDRCENGACVATPLAPTAAGAYGLDVDELYLYWGVAPATGAGTVSRVAKTGGASVVLLDAPHVEFSPRDVRAEGEYVYVLDGAAGDGTAALYRLPREGGSPLPIGVACSNDGATGLALVGDELFFGSLRREGASLYRASKSGAACTEWLVDDLLENQQLAADGDAIYVTQPSATRLPTGSLFALTREDATPVAIAPNQIAGAFNVLPDGDSLLVTTTLGSIVRVGKDGSNPTALNTEAEALPQGLAADAAHVYWANRLSGEVVSYDRSTHERRVVATGQTEIQLLVADATHLYWTTRTHVMRLTK